MIEMKIVKQIGSHNSSVNALYLNYVDESSAEIVTLDEDGVIKVFNPDGSCTQVELNK